MKLQRKIVILASVIVAVFLIFIFWPKNATTPSEGSNKGNNQAESSVFTLKVNIDPEIELSAPCGFSVFRVLKDKMTEQNIPFEYKSYLGMGDLVTRIGSMKNGDSGKYWQYFVNGKYMEIGASAYIPAPGDVVEWKFSAFEDKQ